MVRFRNQQFMEKAESFPIYKEPDFTQTSAFMGNNLQCDPQTPADKSPSMSQIAPAKDTVTSTKNLFK